MYQVELVPAPVSLVGERKSVLLPELAGFTNLCLPATKFGQSEQNLFRLQVLKPLVVAVAYPLVPQVDVRLGFLSVPPSVESRMNILPSLRPCAITRPSSSMKHLRCVNRTYIPWLTICLTDTKFFVIVGTCSMFMSFPFCPTWLMLFVMVPELLLRKYLFILHREFR